MVQCTVGFIFDPTLTQVLLVHKTKPAWQAGKLNGPGGKVEPGESFLDCMVRECTEETCLTIAAEDWAHTATVHEPTGCVQFYAAVYSGALTDAAQGDNEAVEWCMVDALPDTVIPNLRFLIPAAREKLRGDGFDVLTCTYPAVD